MTPPDVTITLGAVPPTLGQPFRPGITHQIAGPRFLFAIEGVGRYLVRDGSTVVVQPAPDSRPEDVLAYLYGSVFGALLHQRGVMVLHGSAVATAQGAVIVVGAAGSGKSTLVAALQRRGYRVLADDICAIRFDEAGRALLYPGLAQLKLWRDAAAALGHDVATLRQVQHKRDKYILPYTPPADPQPLRAIYTLPTTSAAGFRLDALPYARRVEALLQHTYRDYYLREMGLQKAHFQRTANLARQVPLKIAQRPRNLKLLPQFVALIEDDLANTNPLP